jgi:ribosomal protein S18 acetylase RimI-like enzyme
MSLDPATITLRSEQPGDESFLREVYGGTRQEELTAAGMPPEMQAAFLDMQFKAQQHGYHRAFPHAEFGIILLAGQAVGRMVVNRAATEWLLVDVALLPEHRDRGLGTALIQKLLAEAVAAGQPLRLSVLKGQRARRLYERLGFAKTGDLGLHDVMEFHGGGPPSPKERDP